MSYTKGKWFNNGGRIYAQQGDDIREICDVGMVNHQSHEDTANARLIAAAPKLLEACKLARSRLEQVQQILLKYGDKYSAYKIANAQAYDKLTQAIAESEV
jgi:hypothetical protein